MIATKGFLASWKRRLAWAALLAPLSLCGSAWAGGLGAGEQAYARHDYTRAARLLLPEAQWGHAIAQTYLGHMYENGWGVPRDFVEAAKWLTLAADQGEPTAQFLLGRLYDNGSGVKQDFVAAEVYFNLAAAGADGEHRDYWSNMRDAVAGKLTRAELAEAQARALRFTPLRDR